jgi:solute carrier family 35 (UDP-galactose transporter), member B1
MPPQLPMHRDFDHEESPASASAVASAVAVASDAGGDEENDFPFLHRRRTVGTELETSRPPTAPPLRHDEDDTANRCSSSMLSQLWGNASNKNKLRFLMHPMATGNDSIGESQHKSDNGTTANKSLSLLVTAPHHRVLRLLFGAVGICVTYLYYGHVQEDLFRYQSATTAGQHTFDSVWLLQALESATNIGMGVLGRRLFGRRRNLDVRPLLVAGTSQLFAKALTSLALAKGLSFPIVVLAKSGKIVPVMLGQFAMGGSNYGTRDYLFAVLIVAGTALLTAGSTKLGQDNSTDDDSHTTTALGMACLMGSLLMDGVTAGLQKKLLQYSSPTTFDFLLFTSLAMCAVSSILSVSTSDFKTGTHFVQENPAVLRMVLCTCLCSAVGQSFVFYVVATFDPLVCSAITTTRKILSVVWSISTKGHQLSIQGNVGVALAMSGLLLEVHGKSTGGKKDSNRHLVLPEAALQKSILNVTT